MICRYGARSQQRGVSMYMYAHCHDCDSNGLLDETTRLKVVVQGADPWHQCLQCDSLDVDVLSEDGLRMEAS